MRRLMLDNKGSITVEMCFVMPIVICIIMLLISVILRGVDEGEVLGTNQLATYENYDFDLCTDRLRRWQLYGDILWE